VQEANSIILRPSAKTLIVFYIIAACISLAFAVIGLYVAINPKGPIDISLWVCLVGIIAGPILAAIVAWIHLEMKVSVYTITETQAQTRWGLLFKRDDFVQLGAVKSITIHQNPVQRAFNTGDIVLHNVSHSVLILWDVAQPETKRADIWEMVMKASPRNRLRYANGR